MIGVYAITCLVNDKKYIGCSKDVRGRFSVHKAELRNNHHNNKAMQDDWNKYGECSFEFDLLEECSVEELSDKEEFWIEYYGSHYSDMLYNQVQGGLSRSGERNPMYGKHFSEESRSNQSIRMKEYLSDPTHHPMYGKHHTEESKKNISQSLTGRHNSAESNAKRSKWAKEYFSNIENCPFYGHHHTQETKDKIRQINSNRKHTPEELKKMSESLAGNKNPMYGKHLSASHRQTISSFNKNSVWVNDGVKNFHIHKDELDKYIQLGYERGMVKRAKG